MNLYLEEVNEEQYATIKDEITTEYETNRKNKVRNFVNFTTYQKGTIGIYVDGVLVGLFRLIPFIEGLTIDIIILPAYRGKGIAGVALNQLVEEFGQCYPEQEMFYINPSYGNDAAKKAFEKLDWKEDHRFDDMMMDEGGEVFILYRKDNPYYVKAVQEIHHKS